MRHIVTALTALAIATSAATAQEPDVEQSLDAYLAPLAPHLSGRLLVQQGDRTVYDRSWGYANHELQAPITPETRFNIASITKPITVLAFIDLATREKLAMSDPLAKFLPDFPRADEITVEHLLRHRAGIPHRVTDACDETVPHTAQDMVELAAKQDLLTEPGAESIYSSGGFAVLARVLEIASGMTYGELVQKLVFEPVGMTHSAHADSRALLPGRASSYVPAADGGIRNAALQDLSFLVGAGSVYSTADDLARLVRAVRTGALGEGAKLSFVRESGITWNGSTSGFRAFADWHAESDVTVVFTGNLQSGANDLLRTDVPRVAAGESVAPPTVPNVIPVDVPPETLRKWEGLYELRPGSPLRVHVGNDGALYVNDWVLVPTGERRFWSPQDWGTVEVVLDEAGTPTRLDWTVGGEAFPCPRVGEPATER
jgi:CubicO group peptidase (beta-lactamase class C family)